MPLRDGALQNYGPVRVGRGARPSQRYHHASLRRVYFFELFTLAHLALVALLAHESFFLIRNPAGTLISLVISVAAQAVIGVLIRVAVAAVRKEKAYLRRIRRRAWIVETLRLIASGALLVVGYGWLKLVVPLYHARNFDAALWDLDQLLFFGFAPAVFFLDLFGTTGALRVVDWTYAYIFYASTIVAGAYFLSHPSSRIRVAFANGNAVLWVAGAWLYFAVPSLGPAYRFPDIWLAHSEALRRTQELQALLMRNWQNVFRAWNGEPHGPISIAFGIGAFPSLHVAFQTYVFLWMRRLWISGEVLFGIFVFVIFLGSMITGWHYLVDGLAGLLLAYVCFRASFRRGGVARLVERRRS